MNLKKSEPGIAMDQSTEDAGTIAALMIRFREYRLPRAQRMLERVSAGETLSESDIAFLKRIMADDENGQRLLKRHPEYHSLVSKFIDLYSEITARALENEKNAGT